MSLFFKMHATHKSVAKDAENVNMMIPAICAHFMGVRRIRWKLRLRRKLSEQRY